MTQAAQASQKIRIDRSTSGGITLLALDGVVDEGFEGKSIAESVKTKKLVVSLREVRRFASWGMAEWMNFLRATANLDLYLVECSTYAVNQMNLVTGLLGHGKLVSFYSPYRCGSCGEEFETPMLVPQDRAAIRDLADSRKVCATCGGIARMDKYPASMCAAIAERAGFDVDDEVLSFLRSRFKYDLVPDVTRFRAHRRAAKGNTYLRLSGNLANLPPDTLLKALEGTTIVDLAAASFEPTDLEPWRKFVAGALPQVSTLQLLDCPPGFLERGVRAEDLQANLKVRSFVLPYLCTSCNTPAASMIDVAENLEQLIEGSLPPARCPSCQATMVPYASESLSLLRRLPARERDVALDAFLAKARAEPAAKLEDALAPRAAKPAKAGGRGVYLGAIAAAAVLIAGVIVVLFMWKKPGEQVATAPTATAAGVATGATDKPGFQRPDWIMSDVPSSAFCQDMINRLVCVGVSPYRGSRAEAVADANDAALDQLVNAVGLKISEPFFRDSVITGYSDARTKALSALQAVETDRASPAYAAAEDVVRKARHRVVEVLQASGGAAVPAQRSDWYWEEYAVEKGKGTEFLVYVRYDVSLDAVKGLVEKYATPVALGDSAAITAFPGLAWQYPDFAGGAMLTKVSGPFAAAKLAPSQVVVAVGSQHVVDAAALARHVDDWAKGTGDLALSVKAGATAPQNVAVKR